MLRAYLPLLKLPAETRSVIVTVPPFPSSRARLRECPTCGLFQTLPDLGRGFVADCPRCGKVLHRQRSEPFNRSLALSVAACAFFLVAITTPFLSFNLGGDVRETTLLQFPSWFELQGYWELDVVVLCTTVVAPVLVLAMTLMVLAGLRGARPPVWLPVLQRWRDRLRPWAMTEVFLLGTFVAYTRLNALARVEVGSALYALGGLMLTPLASDALLARQAIWASLGRKCGIARRVETGSPLSCEHCDLVLGDGPDRDCPRCAGPLHRRKPNSLSRTWALLIASVCFYVPANGFPILSLTRLGAPQESTILGGAKELLEAGMWPLALLVFCASILVPTLKLVALTWMLVATHRGSDWQLRRRTRLYRTVEVIGRWSMIDVFMLAILVALVRMGILAEVQPRVGAACFAAVVILTMVAAGSFDPRLMWDRAGKPSGADQVVLA